MQSSTLSFGPCLLNKQNSLFPKKNPFLHNFVPPKKLVFPVLKKQQKPLIVKSSTKNLARTAAILAYEIVHSQVFQSFVWVFESLFFKPKPKGNVLSHGGFFEEGDLIRLNDDGNCIVQVHDRNCIVGVVQHIGFFETTLIGPTGLIILQNFKVDKRYSIANCTQKVGDEKLFGFYTLFHCKTDQPYMFIKEIKSELDKNEIIKDNKIHNFAFVRPNDKFRVACYVSCSKLQSPLFKSYLEVSGQVLADVDKNIYRSKTVA